MPIRVLLADDHDMIREGLRVLLQSEPDVEIVAEAGDGRSAVRLAAELAPDVVVMDLRMPDLSGIDATRQVRGDSTGTKVVALSAQMDGRTAREAMAAGASGCLPKHTAFEELAAAVRAVAAGEVYLSPELGGALEGPSAGRAD